MGRATDRTQTYFDDDKYRLQRYLSNTTVITIADDSPENRTSSQNTMFLFDQNEHLTLRLKRIFK